MKDLPLHQDKEEIPVLTWTITTSTEMTVRLKLKISNNEQQEQQTDQVSETQNPTQSQETIPEIHQPIPNTFKAHSKTFTTPKINNNENKQPIVEKKSSFMDRLKMFDNKDKPKFTEKKPIIITGQPENSLSAEQQEILDNNKDSIYEIQSTKFNEQLPKGYTRDCFCEGFFIASFPINGGNVIEKSQEYPSTCGHEQCSMLPAMQSEIIARYPLEDTKTLELNNLAATICSMEALDLALARVWKACKDNGYTLVITADHGNADEMLEANKKGVVSVRTAHSLNPVPFIIVDDEVKYEIDSTVEGGLANVAPTIAKMFDLEYPTVWEKPLIK